MASINLPLVVIVGPTASGKTSLAIEMASRYGGEIICADSRTIYRGINIGTAKPTLMEQRAVRHWGIDLINPGESYSSAKFKEYATHKIMEIRSRGHTPFLVGGTGLYVDSVVFDYKFNKVADTSLRQKLQQLSLSELHDYCSKNNIDLPENYKNKRYVIRSIERGPNKPSKSQDPIENTIIVGITTDKNQLVRRIRLRAEQIFKSGVIDEAKSVADKYGWDNEAMRSNIYPLIHDYLDGKTTLDEAKEKFIVLDRRLAKRQLTWLRRNKYIEWLTLDDARKYLESRLAINGSA